MHMLYRPVRKRVRALDRGVRGARVVALALASRQHPILAHIIPTRRCNLACGYCNEFDSFSQPVPTTEMLRRVNLLAALGTTVVTISGGEPLLHPDLDELIRGIRRHRMMATLITNGYLLTPERIARLNRAGLDQMEISIDNVQPDEVSKKSLKVLDRKLQWLAERAEFGVNVNSVLGSGVRRPEDALVIAVRARELGLTSTVGIIHDHSGQLQPLDARQQAIYERIVGLNTPFYTAALYNRFHRNVTRGIGNDWQCRAGSRYLYVCEDGLVHYCSQQRGYPAISLEAYTREHLEREYHTTKPCARYCTIGCVQRMAMIDELRDAPLPALQRFFPVPLQRPATVRILSWLFVPRKYGRPTAFARAANWFLALGRSTGPPARNDYYGRFAMVDEKTRRYYPDAVAGRIVTVHIPARGAKLQGDLGVPVNPRGVVLFAHGSGSSRQSPRNRFVANYLHQIDLATLVFDLLTEEEERIDRRTSELRFDIGLLAIRLLDATDWIARQQQFAALNFGYFGASTGAAAALVAAAGTRHPIAAIVSRGGRPDLAGAALSQVQAPTLLIVGEEDPVVVDVNHKATQRLRCEKRLEIIPGATHLFEEPGALDQVARLAREWFHVHLRGRHNQRPAA